jgi:hypothetical protein
MMGRTPRGARRRGYNSGMIFDHCIPISTFLPYIVHWGSRPKGGHCFVLLEFHPSSSDLFEAPTTTDRFAAPPTVQYFK